MKRIYGAPPAALLARPGVVRPVEHGVMLTSSRANGEHQIRLAEEVCPVSSCAPRPAAAEGRPPHA